MLTSEYWRFSKVAVKSGKMEKFWELSLFWQAWLVAYFETEEDLTQVLNYIGNKTGSPE